MSKNKIQTSFLSLKKYCEEQEYKGWDPYDGLNSKIFQATPLKHWDLARLAWIQLFKRNPINLRKLFLVPKQHNAKGIGLFLSAYCNLYRIAEKGDLSYGTLDEIKEKINDLANLAINLKTEGYSGACWGYNFDWQARRLFLFPKSTPTVVATTFVATALMEAYEITKNEGYLETALSSANFVIKDLNRTQSDTGFLFSYSPLQGNNTVYNASLLGSKLLSYCYHYTQKETYKDLAKQSVKACIAGQEDDGSWVYGLLPVQSWKDSFHTGYNLEALFMYQELTGDRSYEENIERGFEYYVKHFFEKDGLPKYYHNKAYPVDIHCPGQFLVVLNKMKRLNKHRGLADAVLNWTITHMQDKNAYFYYQIKQGMSSKIPYMRWSNAFMFLSLSHYLLDE